MSEPFNRREGREKEMGDTKHTPGPWTIIKPDFSGPGQFEDRLIVSKTQHMAEVFQYRNEQNNKADGTALANARLIAAAPRMYDYIQNEAEGGNDKEAQEIIAHITEGT